MSENNNSMRAQIVAMEPGEVLEFPFAVSTYATIRGYASELSFTYIRKYRTHRNRSKSIVEVTRIQ